MALWLGYGGLQGYFNGNGVVVGYSDVTRMGVSYCSVVCDDQVQCVSPVMCGDIHKLLGIQRVQNLPEIISEVTGVGVHVNVKIPQYYNVCGGCGE